MESEKWQDTKVWLREFLRVQKMYSDAEIAQLRTDLINADATQMLAILKRIQAKHDSMVWMHQASDKSRQTVASHSRREHRGSASGRGCRSCRRPGSRTAIGRPVGWHAEPFRLSAPRRVDHVP